MHSINNNGHKERPDSREVDLFDIIFQLWKGKKIILCCMILALGVAIAYLFVQKPSWVTTAIVSKPDSGQVANYTNTLLLLYPVNQESDQTSNAVLPFIFDIRATAYEHFSEQLSARMALGQGNGLVTKEVLNMAKPQQSGTYALIYTAQSPDQLDTKLKALLQKINQDVEKQLINDLKVNIALRKQELTDTLAIQDKLAKRPDYTDTSFDTREQLMRISALAPDKMKIESFRYLAEPTTAQMKETKSSTLIILLSLMLGAIAGSVVVLAKNALRNYQQSR